MAFGIPPKHIEIISLESLTKDDFLVIAIESAKKLGWNISQKSESGFTAHTKFSLSSWSEEVTVKIEGNNAELNSKCTGGQVVDWGKNKRNVNAFISTFKELREKLTSEELAQKQAEIKVEFVSEEAEINKNSTLNKGKIADFFSLFIPTEGYFITPIIINLNIAVFILMVLSGVDAWLPDNESLIVWGANFKPVTLDNGWWRLFTSCFLHIGLFHLLMNMYALVYIGLLLEPYLGKSRFLAAYVLTGIMASVSSFWWNDLTISAGASGAIFGMYGVFLAMLTTNLIEKSKRNALLLSIAVFVAYNLINGLKGGIDNAAHLGGLISGFVMGYGYFPSLKKNDEIRLKYISIALLTLVIFSSSVFLFNQVPDGLGEYNNKMELFAEMEASALELFELADDTSNEEVLLKIEEGIDFWNQSIEMIKEADQLELPDYIHERNKKILDYCDLRVKSYESIYRAIIDDNVFYTYEIEEYNRKIEAILTELTEY